MSLLIGAIRPVVYLSLAVVVGGILIQILRPDPSMIPIRVGTCSVCGEFGQRVEPDAAGFRCERCGAMNPTPPADDD